MTTLTSSMARWRDTRCKLPCQTEKWAMNRLMKVEIAEVIAECSALHEGLAETWYLHILQIDDMLPSSTIHHALHFGPFSHHYGHHADFFPSIHEEYYYPPHQQDHQEEDHKPFYSKGKDLSLKDFFEIALTALAFLAFKLFLVQLVMNCTMVLKKLSYLENIYKIRSKIRPYFLKYLFKIKE